MKKTLVTRATVAVRTLATCALTHYVAGGLGLSSCVSTNATLQEAKVVPKGVTQISLGSSLPLPTRYFGAIADQISASAERVSAGNTEALSKEEKASLIESGIALLTLQPAPVLIFDVRRGFGERFDAGLRVAGPAIRADGKFWLRQGGAHGVDVSIDLGLTHHTGAGASLASSVFDFFENVGIAEYARKDAELALLWSMNWTAYVGYYGSLRYVASRYRVQLTVPESFSSDDLSIDDSIHQYGASGGVRLQAGPFRVMAELGLMRMQLSPRFIDEERNLSGFVVEPAIAAALRF